MTDKIINASAANGLQAYAIQTYQPSGWTVSQSHSDYPGKVIARLVTWKPTPYVLMADTVAELQAQLPAGLVRSNRQPSDPPDVLEIWFPAQQNEKDLPRRGDGGTGNRL